MYWDGLDLSKVKTFLLKDEELSRYKLEKGDLLVCEGGDYGRSTVWDKGCEMYYQNALHRIRFFGNLDVYFYKYVFELYRSIGYIIGQGQTIKHFTYENMKGLLFPIPPLMEQKRVVKKIQEVNSVVLRYGKSQNKLDDLNASIKSRLKKSILQESIQGRLVPQDSTDVPATTLLEQIRIEKQKLLKEGKLRKKDIVDSIIFKGEDNKYYEKIGSKIVEISEELPFDIPDSWAWCRLGSVIILQSGQDLIPDRYFAIPKGIPYITGASNLSNGAVLVNRWTNSPTSISHKGDLLITCKGTVGTMAYNTIGDIHIARQIMSIHSGWILIDYIEKYLEFSIPKLEKAAHSIIPGISRGTIQSTLIPIPPIKEQRRIVDRIQELYKHLQN